MNAVEFVSDLWNQSYCFNCLKSDLFFSTPKYGYLWSNWPDNLLSNLTKFNSNYIYNVDAYNDTIQIFFKKLFKLLDCISFSLNDTIPGSILEILNFPNTSLLNFSLNVCQNCSSLYQDFFSHYKNKILSFNEEGNDDTFFTYLKFNPNHRFAVCVDVQFAVNRTEWAWHNLFNCSNVDISLICVFLPFILCTIIILTFYIISFCFFQSPTRRIIYKPNRVEPRGVGNYDQSNNRFSNISNFSDDNLLIGTDN